MIIVASRQFILQLALYLSVYLLLYIPWIVEESFGSSNGDLTRSALALSGLPTIAAAATADVLRRKFGSWGLAFTVGSLLMLIIIATVALVLATGYRPLLMLLNIPIMTALAMFTTMALGRG